MLGCVYCFLCIFSELEEKSAVTPYQYMVQECLYSAVTDKYKHLKQPYHVATFARLKEVCQ